MTSWAGGYVADIEYISGYYRQQSPPHLVLAGLLGGIDLRRPDGRDGAHYIELGCGHGLNAVLVAASNPSWRVTAIDYNPAHVASGMALAAAAAIPNVTFIEADLATFASGAVAAALPAADFVSMHGVWSWVSGAVRDGIVRLLRDKVAPGGIVHVSYNALPAWQGALGLQRIIYEAGRRTAGRSDHQVLAGMETARSLLEAGARHLTADPFPAGLMATTSGALVGYLAHEYMNANWSPCFHADVAAAMAEAKLDWAGSANLLENFPDLALSEQERPLYDKCTDPILQELLKDTCMPRQLRHDVYVRGARRLSNPARDAALRDMTLTLAVPASEFVFELDVPAGRAELGPAFRPMVAALSTGAHTVGDLLSLTPDHSSPAEVAGVLVGTNQALIVERPNAGQCDSADRLNIVLGTRIASVAGPEISGGLASHALGGAFPAARLVQFIAGRLLNGDTPDNAADWFDQLSADVPEDKLTALRGLIAHAVTNALPLLRRAGM